MTDSLPWRRAQLYGDGALTGLARPPRCSLGHGAAGVAYFLWRYGSIAGAPEALDRAADWVATAERDIASTEAFAGRPPAFPDSRAARPTSVLFGEAGVWWTSAVVHAALRDDRRVDRATGRFCAIATACPEDALDVAGGAAGLLLAAAGLLEQLGDLAPQRVHAAGEDLARRLRDAATLRERGPADPLGWLGAAHGWCGVAHALLRWCRATGTRPDRQARGPARLAARGAPGHRERGRGATIHRRSGPAGATAAPGGRSSGRSPPTSSVTASYSRWPSHPPSMPSSAEVGAPASVAVSRAGPTPLWRCTGRPARARGCHMRSVSPTKQRARRVGRTFRGTACGVETSASRCSPLTWENRNGPPCRSTTPSVDRRCTSPHHRRRDRAGGPAAFPHRGRVASLRLLRLPCLRTPDERAQRLGRPGAGAPPSGPGRPVPRSRARSRAAARTARRDRTSAGVSWPRSRSPPPTWSMPCGPAGITPVSRRRWSATWFAWRLDRPRSGCSPPAGAD